MTSLRGISMTANAIAMLAFMPQAFHADALMHCATCRPPASRLPNVPLHAKITMPLSPIISLYFLLHFSSLVYPPHPPPFTSPSPSPPPPPSASHPPKAPYPPPHSANAHTAPHCRV